MQSDRSGRGHKDLQVCRQVYDALSYALADFDDPVLDELVLVSVTPAPNASRVQVTFQPSQAGLDPELALARLSEVSPDLREEVAAEITRKRVPELVFRIAPFAEPADKQIS